MTETLVSLDVESVLADSLQYFIDQYNEENGTRYVKSDVDHWAWVRNEVEWETFEEMTDDGWRTAASRIPPRELNLNETVDRLHSHPHVAVDIVTARTGVENEMETWLRNHGITSYRDFRSTEISKAELGYDVYIDDNPTLPPDLYPDQTQYLILGSHNVAAVDYEQTIVCETVSDAVELLLRELDKAVQ